MKSTNALISAHNISVVKNKKVILKNIDIEINKNDFLTIIGPNGAGKTMLLKCLMEFYKPDSGEITKKPNLKIGYMPQSINIINTMPMSVRNFITVRKKFDEISFRQVISETQTDKIIDKQLSVLSGGELQRVAISRALINKPEIILADEPTGSLDQSTAKEVFRIFYKLKSKNRLIIYATHNRLFANMADCKLELIDGNIKTINARIK